MPPTCRQILNKLCRWCSMRWMQHMCYNAFNYPPFQHTMSPNAFAMECGKRFSATCRWIVRLYCQCYASPLSYSSYRNTAYIHPNILLAYSEVSYIAYGEASYIAPLCWRCSMWSNVFIYEIKMKQHIDSVWFLDLPTSVGLASSCPNAGSFLSDGCLALPANISQSR